MKIVNKFSRCLVASVIGLALVGAVVKSQAVEILTPSLLVGSNLVNNGASLYTNVNSTTVSNTYMRAGTIYTNTGAFQDVTLQKNPDGSAATYYLSGSLLGTNAATTNNITFVLRTVPVEGGRVSTESTNAFTYAINMNGANPVVFCVPIPSLTLGAAKKIRVSTITHTAATGAGVTTIERLNINGGM